jgi:hypothetical protein
VQNAEGRQASINDNIRTSIGLLNIAAVCLINSSSG